MNWLGIDGGGSNLRVVIVDDVLRIAASYQGAAVNPNSVGHELAAERIREGIQAVLQQAGLSTVAGVGIGVAGASVEHSASWLTELLAPVLPRVPAALSSDVEIALVGARGRLDGVVLLAGTGSVAYGRNVEGQTLRAGGWGYLLGDEGSGYWMGMQALRSVTDRFDQRPSDETRLPQQIMDSLGINQPRDMIQWVYHQAHPTDVARLATTVMALAEAGDLAAAWVMVAAAGHLAALVEHVRAVLSIPRESIVFAGGLLSTENALSQQLSHTLGLDQIPTARHEPVVGAALLAKLHHSES